MGLVIPIEALHRMHHFAWEYLPNETAAMIVGYHKNGDDVATGLVRLRLRDATPRMVNWDHQDFIEKAKRFYAVGHFHTHPPFGCPVYASPADVRSAKWLGELYRRQLNNRLLYRVIYQPYQAILGVHNEDGDLVPYRITEDRP